MCNNRDWILLSSSLQCSEIYVEMKEERSKGGGWLWGNSIFFYTKIIVHLWYHRYYDSTCLRAVQVQFRQKSQHWEGEVDTKFHIYSRGYVQLVPAGKGIITFSWSSLDISATLHTGNPLWPGRHDQHKMYSMFLNMLFEYFSLIVFFPLF